MVPATTPWFTALTGMFVTTDTGGINPTLYWTEAGNLMKASLNPLATAASSASSSASASQSAASQSAAPQSAAASPSKKP
jgi:hypothetical protein